MRYAAIARLPADGPNGCEPGRSRGLEPLTAPASSGAAARAPAQAVTAARAGGCGRSFGRDRDGSSACHTSAAEKVKQNRRAAARRTDAAVTAK